MMSRPIPFPGPSPRPARRTNLLASLFVLGVLNLASIALGVGLYYGAKHILQWVAR